MKLTAIQFCPEFGEKEKNFEKVLSYIENDNSEIIVFPELCTTGYFFQTMEESAAVAESIDGRTVNILQKLSIEKNKIIVAGFVERDGNNIYNSAAILLPDSQLSKVYRKTHLFYKERFCFEAGDSGFFVVDYKEWDIKIGLMICYDWRFPEASRTLALLGADLILCPSNLVTNLWHKVMPARAIENKVYFAVVNRTGKESRSGEELFFNGESAIYDYNGKLLSKAGVDEETILTAEIEPEKTRNKYFNDYNHLFNDRKPNMYNLI